MAETLPMTRTVTTDASEWPTTCADLVATLEATKIPPSSPMLEGEATVETFFPKPRERRAARTAVLTQLHPIFLNIERGGSSREATTGLGKRPLRARANAFGGGHRRMRSQLFNVVAVLDGTHLRRDRAA